MIVVFMPLFNGDDGCEVGHITGRPSRAIGDRTGWLRSPAPVAGAPFDVRTVHDIHSSLKDHRCELGSRDNKTSSYNFEYHLKPRLSL
jgi:hypothetical protein